MTQKGFPLWETHHINIKARMISAALFAVEKTTNRMNQYRLVECIMELPHCRVMCKNLGGKFASVCTGLEGRPLHCYVMKVLYEMNKEFFI